MTADPESGQKSPAESLAGEVRQLIAEYREERRLRDKVFFNLNRLTDTQGKLIQALAESVQDLDQRVAHLEGSEIEGPEDTETTVCELCPHGIGVHAGDGCQLCDCKITTMPDDGHGHS